METKDLTRPDQAGARASTRTCVGCGLHENNEELVRLVVGPDGAIAVDAKGGAFGRGAHVHARLACIAKAGKGGLQKSFKGKVRQIDAADLAQAIVEAMERQIEGLVVSALRAKRIAIGGDAATDASRRNEAKLMILACDAQAAADMTEMRRAVSEGRAVAWSTKERLGALVRHGDGKPVAVIAIEDDRIGGAIRSAVHAIDACRSGASPKKATENAAAAASNAERGA